MPRRLPPWSWHGIVAVILAICVGGAFGIVAVITALQEGPVTDSGAAFLNNLGSMLAGALAGWLGGSAVTAANAQRSADSRADQAPVQEADTREWVDPFEEPGDDGDTSRKETR